MNQTCGCNRVSALRVGRCCPPSVRPPRLTVRCPEGRKRVSDRDARCAFPLSQAPQSRALTRTAGIPARMRGILGVLRTLRSPAALKVTTKNRSATGSPRPIHRHRTRRAGFSAEKVPRTARRIFLVVLEQPNAARVTDHQRECSGVNSPSTKTDCVLGLHGLRAPVFPLGLLPSSSPPSSLSQARHQWSRGWVLPRGGPLRDGFFTQKFLTARIFCFAIFYKLWKTHSVRIVYHLKVLGCAQGRLVFLS